MKEGKKDERKRNRGAPLRRTRAIKEKALFVKIIKGGIDREEGKMLKMFSDLEGSVRKR